MSVLLQIEQALVSCNQARFEKVIGLLLKARGVSGITLLGTTEGKDKTRTGVPDIYASSDGKSFLFLACTTVAARAALIKKLHDDIDECLEVGKTGVEQSAIERLILAFNANLGTSDLAEIGAYAASRKIEIEPLPLSEIVLDIQRQYPWIALDEFGIPIDTGQVLPIHAFVKSYNAGKLATPLDTEFRFRDAQVADGVAFLQEKGPVILISGFPGTGKTRLALEIATRLAANESFCQVHCIYNKDLPIFDDLTRYFLPPGNYVIVVDDANRVNGRSHVLDIARGGDSEHIYRFILTVRDYARGEVLRDVKLMGAPYLSIETTPLTRQEQAEYLEKQFGILNKHYQTQIWSLSQGNARLATMAALQAVKFNDLAALHDVTDLYDLYFSHVTDALHGLGDTALKTLGIVGVLRHVRQRDDATAVAIQEAFGISKSDFWTAIDQLHDHELVDLHGHEVAKVSDQVLATYAFFLCFIKHKLLSFQYLLAHFARSALPRIQDAVYGACNTMNVEAVRKVIDQPLLTEIERGSPDMRMKLLQAFWFIDCALTLRAVYEAILALPDSTEELRWDKTGSLDVEPLLSLLAKFSHASAKDASDAIELTLLYFNKRPDQANLVLKLLTDSGAFGLDRHSSEQRYGLQLMVTKAVITTASRSDGHTALLMRVATYFLSMEFEDTFSESSGSISWCRFGWHPCDEAFALRQSLWEALSELFREGRYPNELREFLFGYARSYAEHTERTIFETDLRWIQEWVEKMLSPANYLDCVIVDSLNSRLQRYEINALADVAERFTCPAFELRKLVCMGHDELRDLGHEAWQKLKAERLFAKYGSLSPENLPDFIATCQSITARQDGSDAHGLRVGLIQLFQEIGNRDPQQLAELTRAYLLLKDPLGYATWSWLPTLVKTIGKQATKAIILGAPAFPSQSDWLLTIYVCQDDSDIEREDAEHILALLEDPSSGMLSLRDFRRYDKHKPKMLVSTVQLIIRTRGERAGYLLHNLLDLPGDEAAWLRAQFSDNVAVLKKAYLGAQGIDRRNGGYFDYDAVLFDVVLDLDPGFLTEYVSHQFTDRRWLSAHDENYRNYERLWRRTDWPDLFVSLVDSIAGHEESHTFSYLAAWFPHSGTQIRPLSELEFGAVLNLIRVRASNQRVMSHLFDAISSLPAEPRLAAFNAFLSINASLDDFRALSLRTGHSVMWGSLLSQYADEAAFAEQVLPLLAGVDLIGHRAFVNGQIRALRARMDEEEQREFHGFDW